MRYYEFTIITNSEKIRENTKVKLNEYSYNGSISAVNEFMYRTLRNGITFCAYREEENMVSALFCYDERKDTYYSSITSDTNIDVIIKNKASIDVKGDRQTDVRYKDTAYGIRLICNENETGKNGTINITLDDGKINTSGSDFPEAGIRIDNYKGNINIEIKNNSSITVSNGYGIHLNNCTGKINITVSDSTISASNPLLIEGERSKNINLVGISEKNTG